jgi:tetratricopeptide (TPR) repeat protein
MAEETEGKDRGKRRDETSEITVGDLEPVEAAAEIEEVDEIEEIEEVAPSAPPPSPGPAPGLGKPRRPAARSPTSTLKTAVPPVVAARRKEEASKPSAPPPTPASGTRPPPPPKSSPEAAIPKMTKAPSIAPPAAEPALPKAVKAPPVSEAPAPLPPTDDSAEELRALCERQIDAKPDPERAARLSYELGRLHEVELNDAAKAADHYQMALRHAPDHAAALRGARRTLAGLGRHAALPPLFDAEVKITREPAARARLLYAKARVMEEHLRQAGPALKVYREALALDPGNLSVLKAIERALRRDKAWGELAQTYELLANSVEDPSLRAAWTSVRARITETELKDPIQAAALYESALAADPHATASLASVKRLSVGQKRWPQLVSALERELELCQDADDQLALLATMARIHERRLGDVDAAAKALEKAVALRPVDRALLADLGRLHRAAGRHQAEADALARLVEQTEGKDARAALSHRIGLLYEQELKNSDRARPWYERAATEDPTHRATTLALVHLHEQRDDWEAVVRVWAARADSVPAPKERALLHHRIGEIVERKLGKPERAAEHHAKALGLDPDHTPAFEDLARLLAQAGRWLELAEIYQRAIDRAPNDDVKSAWLLRLGMLQEDRLGNAEAAIASYDRILERDPKNVAALHAVERAAERAKRWDRLVAALTAEASRTTDKTRAHALRHRAAEVTLDGIGDRAAAARALEAIVREDPKHRASLETLASILSDAGKWEELVAVYRQLLPLLSSAGEKVRLCYRMGELYERELGNDKEAITAYREAARVDPEFTPAIDALHSALARTGAHQELATALEERLLREAAPAERARIATELGSLYEERLGKPDLALASYEKALAAIPLHRPALDARERLLTDAGNWADLVSALQAEAAATSDPFLKLQASLQAALLLAEQQGAVTPALEAFRPVFSARPDHIGALLAIEEIYARTRDDEGLAATYAKMADVIADPKGKLAALQELARARAAAGGDSTDVQRRILRLSADDSAALEALAAEAEKRGDRQTLLAMQARLASTSTDPLVGAFHQSRVGEILLADGDAGGALAAFRAALALDQRSLAATRGLTRAARKSGDAEALRQAARHEEDVTHDHSVAVGLLLEAAKLRRAKGDLSGAAEDSERALALDPDSEAAAIGLRAARVTADEVLTLIEHLSRAALAAKNPARACALHLSVAQLQAESKGDLPAAVAATQRALTARPDDGVALSRLAQYLEKNGQWKDAAETLEKLIGKAKEDALVDAHLRLASISEKHLGDAEAAIRSLRAVLKRTPDRADALIPLMRLERTKGRDEEALRLAKKLMEVATDENQKAEALAEIAQLELGHGQPAAAAAAAFSAIGMSGPRSSAARVYRDLVAQAPQHASWDNYATALMTYLEKRKPTGAEVSATYRELARVFSEAHNRPDRAIATLREGVDACPGDPDIGLALAGALAKLGAQDKALAEIRRLIDHDVRIAPAWRAMADRARATNEADGAAVTLAPLVALGQATEDEARIVRSRQPRVAEAPAGILGEGGIKQLAPGVLETPIVGLVHALSDVIAKIESIDYERQGVTKRDRIRAGEPHPVRAFADRIGAIFVVPEFDLFLVRSLDHAIVLPGSPPALLVPSALESARDPMLAFELARPLALLARGLTIADKLAPEDLELLLFAAARQYEPDFGGSGPDLESETKRVGKALPWLQRGRIQEAATTFAASSPDVQAWTTSVRRLAARAAVLVCDDLLSAIEALREPLGPDNTASDLARFWVSDPAMRFRRAVAQQI